MKSCVHMWQCLAEFLEWEMFQTKFVEKIKTHLIYVNFFFENRAVYEIIWKKYCTAGQATDDNIINCMRFTCWVNATDKHSEYLIVIAFPQQQRFRERGSMLHYMFIASLVFRNKSLPLRTILSDFAHLAERNLKVVITLCID
jgi:hypothetical protein